MKSIFETSTRDELKSRINSLQQGTPAQWGKMNLFQMLKHCTLCEDMFLGELKIKRVFIGRIIGPSFLKKVLKDDAPFGKNSPTSPHLKEPNENGDIQLQKEEWLNRIEKYATYDNNIFIHPFFGPMTKKQMGLFAYKHADHHLRQFGA